MFLQNLFILNHCIQEWAGVGSAEAESLLGTEDKMVTPRVKIPICGEPERKHW